MQIANSYVMLHWRSSEMFSSIAEWVIVNILERICILYRDSWVLAILPQYDILIFYEFNLFFEMNVYSSWVIRFFFIIFIPWIAEMSPNLVWMVYPPLAYKGIISTVSAVMLKGLSGMLHHTQKNMWLPGVWHLLASIFERSWVTKNNLVSLQPLMILWSASYDNLHVFLDFPEFSLWKFYS